MFTFPLSQWEENITWKGFLDSSVVLTCSSKWQNLKISNAIMSSVIGNRNDSINNGVPLTIYKML